MSHQIREDDGHVTVGPWGGQNGARWDDGVLGIVRQVVISHGAAIDSILTEYDNKGCSVWSDKHGGTGGFKTDTVKFNYPDEFLVSISGYYGSIADYGPVVVRSLTFESDKKKYGPFGLQQGTHFSFPMNGGMVVGFYGRSSWSLQSIGVHLKPLLIQNPSGNFNFTTSQNHESRGFPQQPRGFEMATPREEQDNIILPKDQLGDSATSYQQPEISIHKSGYSGSTILRGTTVVKSVTIRSDRRMYRPFATADEQQGISFLYPSGSSNGMIAGHGLPARKGVDATEKKPTLPRPSNDSFNIIDRRTSGHFSDAFYTNDKRNSQIFPGMVKEPAAWFSSGPWGGRGGKLWDDGIHSGVKKISLFKGEAIYSIQIEYDRNGLSILPARHGGGMEGSSHTIIFRYPLEILTSFCGYYESLTGDESATVMKSLTFFTNKGKYGPFGEESGKFFTSTKIEGKVVGFHGKCGCYLNAIGVHMQLQR